MSTGRSLAVLLISCVTTPAVHAGGCGMTLSGLNGDQAEFIDGIAQLRASRVKTVREFSSCDTSERWCKTGELIGAELRFDQSGRLIYQRLTEGSTPTSTKYRGAERLPSEESDGGTVTIFHRGRDGRLLKKTWHGGEMEIRWKEQGGASVAYTPPNAKIAWERGFINGRLAWEEMEGMPTINLQTLTPGTPSSRSRTECAYTSNPDGNLRIETFEVSDSARILRSEEIRDPHGLPVRYWALSLNADQAAKGLGTGTVRRYTQIDDRGNWTGMEICRALEGWERLQDCKRQRRILTYW